MRLYEHYVYIEKSHLFAKLKHNYFLRYLYVSYRGDWEGLTIGDA